MLSKLKYGIIPLIVIIFILIGFIVYERYGPVTVKATVVAYKLQNRGETQCDIKITQVINGTSFVKEGEILEAVMPYSIARLFRMGNYEMTLNIKPPSQSTGYWEVIDNMQPSQPVFTGQKIGTMKNRYIVFAGSIAPPEKLDHDSYAYLLILKYPLQVSNNFDNDNDLKSEFKQTENQLECTTKFFGIPVHLQYSLNNGDMKINSEIAHSIDGAFIFAGVDKEGKVQIYGTDGTPADVPFNEDPVQYVNDIASKNPHFATFLEKMPPDFIVKP